MRRARIKVDSDIGAPHLARCWLETNGAPPARQRQIRRRHADITTGQAALEIAYGDIAIRVAGGGSTTWYSCPDHS